MPMRSKWQSLPTEAINPATLGIDKVSADDIVEMMLSEDRKMLADVEPQQQHAHDVGTRRVNFSERRRRAVTTSIVDENYFIWPV